MNLVNTATTGLNRENHKEIKNYENFMHFIENKLNSDENKPSTNY